MMIARTVDENTVSVTAEDADDLLRLRRVIRAGDRISGDTTRAIRRERDYSRPDRGERIRIRILLEVERISLDSVVDRLRVSGVILESSNEEVPHGSHHSMLLNISEPFAVYKKRWNGVERGLVRPSRGGIAGFVLVAIDRTECGIARLDGTHLETMPDIHSGSGGKRYKTSFNPEKFFRDVGGALASVVRDGGGDTVVIFGPGETRKKFANFVDGFADIKARTAGIRVAEGIDSGGEDGIHLFTRSDAMREMMSESKIARVAGIIDDVMVMANRRSRRFTMGLAETGEANRLGAVKSIVFSDRVFEDGDEQEVVELLNDAESRGACVFGVDSSTDLGLRVTGLGGIVSTLRFAVKGDGD